MRDGIHPAGGELIAAIAARVRPPEASLSLELAAIAASDATERGRIELRAAELIAAARARAQAGSGVEQFLQEYQLSTPEGIVLLCLAEAFLRIPDAETADRLIKDKLGSADWERHLGHSPSRLVNLGTRALMITTKVIDGGDAGPIAKLMARGGEPLVRTAVRAAMRVMGGQFVMGRTITEALSRATAVERLGFRHSYDMLGEAARTAADADRYQEAYAQAIRAIGKAAAGRDIHNAPNISVKLSALHPRYEVAQAAIACPALAQRLTALCLAARQAGIGLTVDAEESERLMLSLTIIEQVAADSRLKGWDGFGLAVQAYQKRALPVIQWVADLARRTDRRIMVRLVKGAYWDSEVKRTQERGLTDYPVFTRKAATDVSYLACARAMFAAGRHLYPAFATHNALTIATVMEWAGTRRDFEFQRLHGMGDGLYEPLLSGPAPVACRIYAPVGDHRDLLAYLVRRLLENGANTSFVHKLADPSAPLTDLLTDPVAAVRAVNGRGHPHIRLPRELYGAERANSGGLDLADDGALDQLETALAVAWRQSAQACPIVDGRDLTGPAQAVRDPADTGRVVGQVVEATPAHAAAAMAAAARGAEDWARSPVETRAACLDRAADLLEARRTEFMALAIREAGKTIPDALGEVREAVDFCRYYAARARQGFQPVRLPGPTGEQNELVLTGRGVFVCISPWNFPLAIFLGQVAAALVAGNAVVAKPAPQTPLIADRAVRLLLEAGIPPAVLHLVPGGPEIGKALVAHDAVGGVAFTGSTAAARAIHRALAAKDSGPIVPLIAETGGQNAMIVDSSALPEQVVADVLISGFQSAGQRCSALRVLYLQEDCADRVTEMLKGAMDELRLGDPGDLATDIGPVIDQAAQSRLANHISANTGRVLHRLAVPAPTKGWFVPPTLIALDRLNQLPGEVFGPIVHVRRWAADRLDDVVDEINATGFGLTMGIHSRIGRTIDQIRARAKVGNLYVNRSMIGAVVGVQPFGGEGLSGTGPKAGGPHYLARFASERTVSVDVTSAGGNASLMAMSDSE